MIARPLPKTNKLAFRKNNRSDPVVPEIAAVAGIQQEIAGRRFQTGTPVRAIMTITPAVKNIQTTSRSVIAVEIARTKKIAQSSLSFLIAALTSFVAERAIMAITAAPIP